MKQILISADGPIHLCLVPDIVANNLYKYICDFDDYVYKYRTIQISELEYRTTVEEVSGFIDWLNEMFDEESKLVRVLDDNEYEQYKRLESWNW